MGYKIWRRDPKGWSLAFDYIYETREDVDERIAELNAEYNDKIKYGELAFYPYRDDIKLARDGSVIDDKLPIRKPHRRKRRSRKISKKLSKRLAEEGRKAAAEVAEKCKSMHQLTAEDWHTVVR